jgi:hypothetical protein
MTCVCHLKLYRRLGWVYCGSRSACTEKVHENTSQWKKKLAWFCVSAIPGMAGSIKSIAVQVSLGKK